MENQIDLNKFCSIDKDKTRININQPWSRGEYTYATNGVIIIRVSRLPNVPENPVAPDGDNIFLQSAKALKRTWHTIPPYTLERKPCKDCKGNGYFQKCDNCEGKGYVGKNDRDCSDCDGEGFKSCAKLAPGAYPCEDCDGEGRGRPECCVDFMAGAKILARLQGAYLELVKDFPHVQLGIAGHMDPVIIRFDSGEGLIMPILL